MYKYFLLIIVALSFVSCSLNNHQAIKPNEKSFAQEDMYIMLALRAEEIKDNKSASNLYKILYNRSKKREYLYRSLQNDLLAKDNEKLINRVDKYLNELKYDEVLVRLKVVSLFELNRLDEANMLSIELSAKTQDAKDYLLASDVLIKRQEYDLAVKYLESAYAHEYNEKILDKMSVILYVNLNRKKEAIAYLETHSRMHSCSKRICNRLIGFYSNDNNISGLLSTYLKLYKIDNSEKIAKRIIQIYTYKQDYISLIDFLEESQSDDEALLQLYVASKNYKKAYPLSYELYDKTLNVDYLAQSAIYEYENAENKNADILLSSVVKKLSKVVENIKSPIYMNYLGYLLIDHNIDVKKGMSYIDEVLKIQPNSAFYLDSKAWGYYKLGDCSKAKNIMDEVVTLKGGNDLEVHAHIKSINKCLKNKKVISKK